jgi:hypothetical protein
VAVRVSGCRGWQTWHTTKLALISCALYVPVSVVMITMAWSSKKHRERHLHSGIPVFISGVAFLCAAASRVPCPARPAALSSEYAVQELLLARLEHHRIHTQHGTLSFSA